MILILGPEDIHTRRVMERIQLRQKSCALLTSDLYPKTLAITATVNTLNRVDIAAGNKTNRLVLPSHPDGIALDDITAVYWYGYSGVAIGADYPLAEAESAFGAFLRKLNCRWVNPPQAIDNHRYKFHQLCQLHQAGLAVPDTLMTNEPDALVAFYEKHRGNIICKPFYQGLMLHQLTPQDLSPEQLARLCQSPTLFQEHVKGTDIRVHVVGEQLFASQIVSEQFNYKTQFTAKPVELSPHILTQCRQVTETLGLVLAGVDLRIKPDGDCVFFEANPSPQFMTFEDQWWHHTSPYPITEALVDVLLTG